jgi:hypothetical protein
MTREAHTMVAIGRLSAILLVLAFALACGTRPTSDLDAAKAAFDKASVTAGQYAAESLKAAKDAKAKLDAELATQDAKWIKSYDHARELAASVRMASEKAIADATAEKARAEAVAAAAEKTRANANADTRAKLTTRAERAGGATRTPTLPDGIGVEDSKAVTDAYGQAVLSVCALPTIEERTVMTAQGSVRGISSGQRIGGRLWIGIDVGSGSLRLESVQGAAFDFVFVANDAIKSDTDTSDVEATLVLPRGERVVRDSSRRLIEAVIGVPLTAQEFIWTFTGCPTWGGSIFGRRFGDTWMKLWVGDVAPLELVVHRTDLGSPWALLTMVRNIDEGMLRWRTAFSDRVGGLARGMRIVSLDWNGEAGRAFDVQLSLNRIQVGPVLGSATFSVVPPSSARRVSLDTLRQERPRGMWPVVNDP